MKGLKRLVELLAVLIFIGLMIPIKAEAVTIDLKYGSLEPGDSIEPRYIPDGNGYTIKKVWLSLCDPNNTDNLYTKIKDPVIRPSSEYYLCVDIAID